MNSSDHIVIVGGGSSGWMTAATLINSFPNKKITLIESPNHPIIGVGESTQATITTWAHSLGINHEDFMRFTDASYKMSIRFKNFNKKEDKGFHYPFGKIYLENTHFATRDWYMKKLKYPQIDNSDYCNSFYSQMSLINNSKINLNKYGIFDNYDFYRDTAYHFDAVKFGIWLKERYCLPRGVNHIQKEIVKIETDNNGISLLIFEDGNTFSGDLYVDCTGFKSMLLEETLGVEFESIEDQLLCNKAWAVQIPYVDKEKEIENFTNSTALGHGWVWNTPLWSRIGTGYVYSDRFTTDEEALEEFKNHLKNKTEPIYAPERITDDLKFRNITMKTGIHKTLWEKNVIAIGLSAGFIEPLESNGLYTVHEFASLLCKVLNKEKINNVDKQIYTAVARDMFFGFMKFVQMHYTLSQRDDTEFWKYMTSVDVDFEKVSGYRQILDTRRPYGPEFETESGVHCIATGHGYSTFNNNLKNLFDHDKRDVNFDLVVESFIYRTDQSKKKWEEEANLSPTHYAYLKQTFHSEDVYEEN